MATKLHGRYKPSHSTYYHSQSREQARPTIPYTWAVPALWSLWPPSGLRYGLQDPAHDNTEENPLCSGSQKKSYVVLWKLTEVEIENSTWGRSQSLLTGLVGTPGALRPHGRAATIRGWLPLAQWGCAILRLDIKHNNGATSNTNKSCEKQFFGLLWPPNNPTAFPTYRGSSDSAQRSPSIVWL